MANEIYRREMLSRITGAVARYRYSAQVDHSGMQGKIREIAVQDLLAPILPSSMKCGTGKIIDADEAQSNEIDVIVSSAHTVGRWRASVEVQPDILEASVTANHSTTQLSAGW